MTITQLSDRLWRAECQVGYCHITQLGATRAEALDLLLDAMVGLYPEG